MTTSPTGLTHLPRTGLTHLPRRARGPSLSTMTGLVLSTLLLGACATQGNSAPTVPVRLMAFNDFHGHLEPGSNSLTVPAPEGAAGTLKLAVGGAPWLAGTIDALRAQATHSVVISSGDMIGAAPLVSTLFRHESTIDAMNALGVDLGVVGNHEFDAGLTELRRVLGGGCAPTVAGSPFVSCARGAYSGARFPVMAANVEDAEGKPVLPPYVVREFEGERIGFIGVVTRSTPAIVVPSGIAGLKFLNEAATLNRYAQVLRSQGVRAIVAVVHEGGETKGSWNDPSCPGASGDIFEIADKLSPDIDVVFSAHTHQGYACVVDTPHQKGLRIVQATSYGRGLAVVDVQIDRKTHEIDRQTIQVRNVPILNDRNDAITRAKFSPVTPRADVAAIVDAYAALAAPRAQRVVGRINGRFEREAGGADFAAGRLIADAQLAATQPADRGGAQMALMNVGGIRASLTCPQAPPCDVTYGQVFTMQPFGNSLVVMTLTGRQLKAVLEDQHKPSADAPHFLQPSAGLSYTWKRSAPYGERVRDLTLNGTPIDGDAKLRVTVNSYLAEGGDGFKRLRDGTDRLGGMQDVDALVDYLGRAGTYSPIKQGRIRIDE